MEKQAAATTRSKWRRWKKVDFWIKLQLKYVKYKSKHHTGDKNPPHKNEFEVAISYQNSEIVSACLKPRKFFIVWEGTKIHSKTKYHKGTKKWLKI